jgi:hypothetical protein
VRETGGIGITDPPEAGISAGVQTVKNLEHGLRAGTDPVIVGEVDPAHGAGRIDQDLGRPGDGLALGGLVNQSVAAQNFRLRVAQEGEGPAGLGEVRAELFRRVGADRDRPDAAPGEFRKLLVETP